jgi:Tol biopolymer transport system component
VLGTLGALALAGGPAGHASFSAPANGPIVFDTTRDAGNGEIYRMEPDGTGLVNLTNHPNYDQYASWSPDGSRILFMRWTTNFASGTELFVMDPDGSNQANLTNRAGFDGYAAWSPDGTKIVWTRGVGSNSSTREIWVMDSDGTDPVALTTSPGIDQLPSWSPDGGRIAFDSVRDGNFEIYTMNAADGTNVTRVTNDAAVDEDPAWSVNGSRLAWHTNRTGDYEIFAASPDGTGPVNLTNAPGSDSAPNWSPDGTKIGFTTDREGDPGAGELYEMATDGSSQARLSDGNPAFEGYGDWGPGVAPAATGGGGNDSRPPVGPGSSGTPTPEAEPVAASDPVPPPTIEVLRCSAPVRGGRGCNVADRGRLRIEGQAGSAAGTLVTIQGQHFSPLSRSSQATRYRNVTRVRTGPGGSYSVRIRFAKTQRLRASADMGTSASLPIYVRPRIRSWMHRAAGRAGRRLLFARPGQRMQLSLRVRSPKRRLVLRVERRLPSGRHALVSRRVMRTRRGRIYRLPYTAPMRRGTYRLRVLSFADRRHAVGRMHTRTLRVR